MGLGDRQHDTLTRRQADTAVVLLATVISRERVEGLFEPGAQRPGPRSIDEPVERDLIVGVEVGQAFERASNLGVTRGDRNLEQLVKRLGLKRLHHPDETRFSASR